MGETINFGAWRNKGKLLRLEGVLDLKTRRCSIIGGQFPSDPDSSNNIVSGVRTGSDKDVSMSTESDVDDAVATALTSVINSAAD